MTLYYQGARARITDRVFVSRSPYQRTFAIRELRYVHIAQDVCRLPGAGAKPVRYGTSRPHELWAFYRGRFVCLYADPDRIRFAQVTRAMKRLLENMAEAA